MLLCLFILFISLVQLDDTLFNAFFSLCLHILFNSYISLDIKLGVNSVPYLFLNSNAKLRVSVGTTSCNTESTNSFDNVQFFLFLHGSSLKSLWFIKLIVPHVSPYSDNPLYCVFFNKFNNL